MASITDPRASLSEDPLSLSGNANPPRLSLPYALRLPIGTSVAFLSGMFLGLSHGSQVAGLRFRAENAHRLPKTSTGWYLYHKSKNYHVMFGGVKEGVRMGGKLALLVGAFATVEEAVDRTRGTKDFLSTVVAGLGIAGGFSVWSQWLTPRTSWKLADRRPCPDRFPLETAARTAKSGLVFGLTFGLVQDAIGLARGRGLAYVDTILGRGRASTAADALQLRA